MDLATRYSELQAETTSILDTIGRLLADLCEGSGAQHGASEGLDINLGSFYETFSSLKARHSDQNLTVAVLALTKSGKLTAFIYLRTVPDVRDVIPEVLLIPCFLLQLRCQPL